MAVVGIASLNPVKARAILAALGQLFPDDTFRAETAAVPSGVADQPLSDAETLRGALQRLVGVRAQLPDCDYWAAIEGGVQDEPTGMVGLAWVVVQAGNLTGRARTATFPLPPRMAELVRAGVELGLACDQLYGKQDIKHREGAIGLLSHDVIDRQALYQHAAVMALLPFCNRDWYQTKS